MLRKPDVFSPLIFPLLFLSSLHPFPDFATAMEMTLKLIDFFYDSSHNHMQVWPTIYAMRGFGSQKACF
jgi:hypothetical protein